MRKYDVKKGSATWRHKMREAHKKGGLEVPERFKTLKSDSPKRKALKNKQK